MQSRRSKLGTRSAAQPTLTAKPKSSLATSPASPTRVFINCPFDTDYKPYFEAAIFTIVRCGFAARSALEVKNSGEARISKIARIMEECPLGIHDISRTELDNKNQLPRFNMPLELGLFLGAQFFGDKNQRQKACLVMDREEHRYQKFISDIAGQDISSHGGEIKNLVIEIRNFLNTHDGPVPLPDGTKVWEEYEIFLQRLPEICAELKLTEDKLEFRDLNYIVADYVSEDTQTKPSMG